MEVLFKFVIMCFSLSLVLIAFAGGALFIKYINKLDSTSSTIVYTGIIILAIVSTTSNLSYMGVPFAVICGVIIMSIGYGCQIVKLLL